MNHFAGDVINIIIIPVSECDKKSTQKEIDNIYVGGLKSGRDRFCVLTFIAQ